MNEAYSNGPDSPGHARAPAARAGEETLHTGAAERASAAFDQVLRQSESRLRSVAAHVPGMVYQLLRRRDGVLVFPYVSEGSVAVCGRTPAEIRDEPERLFGLILPEDRSALFRAIFRAGGAEDAPTALNWEGRFVFAKDDVKWVNFRATPIALPGGEILWEGIVLNITDNKHKEEEIQQSRSLLRELSAHLESVREEERARIAREIHDELGQWLTALKMDLAWLRSGLKDARPELAEKAQAMSGLVDETIGAVRRIASDLRPAVLDLGLTAAIEWQTQEFETRTGIRCDLSLEDEETPLSQRATTALYRIVQESLTNVARHARATHVTVRMKEADGLLCLCVQDDGCGMDAGEPARDRYGLLGIHERAFLLGGSVEIESAPGGGTTLCVRIPLNEARAP